MTNARLACGFLLVLLGCGDDSAVLGGSGGGTAGAPSGGSPMGGAPSGGAPVGGDGSGGDTIGGRGEGGGVPSGDCVTNADCPPDGACIEIVAGGYHVCQYPIVEATACGSKADSCCDSSDCKGVGETCLVTPVTPFCGGVKQEPHNVCASDQCAADTDCEADQICAPAGTLGNQVRVCLTALCQASCAADVPCTVIENPCCNAAQGLFCASGCVTDADCPGGYCDVDPETQESVCVDGGPICPA